MMTIRQKIKRLDWLRDVATDYAMDLVEEMARDILRRSKKYDEFVMGMGTAMFSVKGSAENVGVDEKKHMRLLWTVLKEHELLGYPMRFTVDGPKITDW